MGEVIQMAGWKNKLMERRRTKVKETCVAEPNDVCGTMVNIGELLKEANLLTNQLYCGQLETVELRENAAVKSFQLVNNARKLADSIGIVINKKPDGSWIYAYPPVKVPQTNPKPDNPNRE